VLIKCEPQIPHNTDSLKCSPLFEIRDTQTASSDLNNFGNGGGLAQNSAPKNTTSTNTPGPPFHVAQANLNLDIDPSSYGYFSNTTADSPQYQLPNRNRSQHRVPSFQNRVTLIDSLSPPASDESRSPGNVNADQNSTRSSSYKDSSSHTSFSPPSMDDTQQTQQQQINSPSRVDSTSSFSTTPGTGMSAGGENYYNGVVNNFANFQTGLFSNDASGILPTQTGWEMSGIELGTSSGLTPMADQPWSQMLDGIQDWSGGLQADQHFDARNRRAS
jgi:hypothetical protein